MSLSAKLSLNKDQIFVMLKEQNDAFHQPLDSQLLKRKHSQYLLTALKANQVIAIEGVRNSGKTTVLRQLQAELIKECSRQQILYIDLEDYRFINLLKSNLIQLCFEIYCERVSSSGQVYIFIEGVNALASELRLALRDFINARPATCKIILSYSGIGVASLVDLTKDQIHQLYPLSYAEWVVNAKQSFGIASFTDYQQQGGIALLTAKGVDYAAYLDVVLMRDVVEQHQIRNVNILRRLAIYLINSLGERFSYNRAAQDLDASINTIREYVAALEASGLFILVDEVSSKDNASSTSQSKVHVVDNGLARSFNLGLDADLEKNLISNTILLELLRASSDNDLSVYYHKGKRECDFLIERNAGIELLQIVESTQSIRKVDSDIRIKGLLEAYDRYQDSELKVLNVDGDVATLKTHGADIAVIPVWDWVSSISKQAELIAC